MQPVAVVIKFNFNLILQELIMTTRNRFKTVLTLAAVAMAILALTATHQVSAAELTLVTTVEVWHQDLEGKFNVSVYPGKASYSGKSGAVTGDFGDGTVLDYRFFHSPGNVFSTYADGGAGLAGPATATNSNGDGEAWADAWTVTDPGVNFSSTADFVGNDLKTLARSQGITGTVDISGLGSGTLYFIYGSYESPNTVFLTMSGGCQDLTESHTEDPPGRNIIWISSFNFADADAYDTITYSYTNTDTDGSRARFMGVIVDGVPADANLPDVDAGADMISWSGKAVPLNPDVNEADGSDWTDLTYLWTADPAEGVVFDPNVNPADPNTSAAEDPNVTITKEPVLIPFVANGGFEDPVLDEDGYTWGDVPGWTLVGGEATDIEGSGVWNVTLADFDPVLAPEGENVLFTEYLPEGIAKGVAQVLTEKFAADTDYTLTVEVGNSYYYYFAGYSVQLLAGGIVIAEDNDTLWPDYYKWATSTVEYTYDPGDSGLVGQPLEIRLLNLGLDKDSPPEGEVVGVEFDDVTLLIDGESGVYVHDPTMSTVTLCLAVNNEGNPPEKAAGGTMSIDVYDNACLAALATGLMIDQTDLDGDCITNFEDFAALATPWLDDYKSTGPAVKP